MVMADASKRINLTAPLLSVRRHGGGGGGGAQATATTGLPAYKAGATSEPPGHTHTSASAVPFGWEHRPGHPKSVRTHRPPPPHPPPLTIADVDEPSRVTRDPAAAAVAVASERAREARRSDALSRDDLSCVTVNCSATGLSVSDAASGAAGARTGTGSGPGPFARGSVMMDRFLPAAHAVAAGSPQSTFRKARSARAAPLVLTARAPAGGDDRLPAQRWVPFQHIAPYHLPLLSPSGKNDDGDDDGDANSVDAHSTAGFASKRCGLLSTRCVKSALLLSRGGSQREKKPLLPPRSRTGPPQQQLPHTGGDDHGMQCLEEVYIKSLLRSIPGGVTMGPAAAVASELDRTVCELYKRRDGQAVRPKASHLGLLLVLDRSHKASCGHASPARKLSRTGDTALLLKATTKSGSPNGEKQLGRDAAADAGGGGYGFPLLLEDKEAVAGREMALSPQPMLPLPLPRSPTESWLSRALPSVSTRPPATSFLGLHVQPKKRAPLPWCSIDSSRGVHHDKQRQICVHDLQK